MQTRSGARFEHTHYERARVEVIRGPDQGLALEAAGRTLVVGTAGECDLVLRDDTVSRRHCEIELDETGFRVRDLGSTNGVCVGALRVYDVAVTGRLEIALGETTLAIAPLAQVEERARATAQTFGELLGGSRKMRELFAELERFAETELSVLIEGETGTGKELVAESIHRASRRAGGPYVVFDCAAIAPTLAESELFGHERGAFTGALSARPGVFEQAHGGTLFLDEIGELPRELQPKLLRALERGEVKRLGAREPMRVDVRVISATHRQLAADVRSGAFRADLYYRVAAARVAVPPLRERADDIPMLVAHFMASAGGGVAPGFVAPQALQMFMQHRWPGNVRELRNAVQRLIAAPALALEIPASGSAAACEAESRPSIEPLRVARRNATDAFERGYLGALLARTEGNVTRAAAIAEVSRQMIQKLMRAHGVGE